YGRESAYFRCVLWPMPLHPMDTTPPDYADAARDKGMFRFEAYWACGGKGTIFILLFRKRKPLLTRQSAAHRSPVIDVAEPELDNCIGGQVICLISGQIIGQETQSEIVSANGYSSICFIQFSVAFQ